jgi:hypothetical protein
MEEEEIQQVWSSGDRQQLIVRARALEQQLAKTK